MFGAKRTRFLIIPHSPPILDPHPHPHSCPRRGDLYARVYHRCARRRISTPYDPGWNHLGAWLSHALSIIRCERVRRDCSHDSIVLITPLKSSSPFPPCLTAVSLVMELGTAPKTYMEHLTFFSIAGVIAWIVFFVITPVT